MRGGVVVLDGEPCARAQPPHRQGNHGTDHCHAVRAAEQRVVRIMFGHFGSQFDLGGYVGRVADDEINPAVEVREQAGGGHVGLHQFDVGTGGVSLRIPQRRRGVVDRDNGGPGNGPSQGHGQRSATGAEIDDQRVRPVLHRFERPPQQRLRLRARNEHPGSDVQHQRPERRQAGQMLQRDPP